MIKLSSVSSYVVIENVIGFVVKENYLNYLSSYNQTCLRKIKESVEKAVCCS